MPMTWLRLALAVLLSLAACAPGDALARYEEVSSRYNAVVVEARGLMREGQFRVAFTRLARAERGFGAALAALDLPQAAQSIATDLTGTSGRLAELYRDAAAEPDDGALISLMREIRVTRDEATQLSERLRRALVDGD